VLLGSVIVSAILPFINLQHVDLNYGTFVEPVLDEYIYVDYEQTLISTTVSNYSALEICKYLYLISVTFLFIRLLTSIFALVYLRIRSNCIFKKGYWFVEGKVTNVFSFFNWIYLPNEDRGETDQAVILHEQQHAKLYHSLDLLLVEILMVVLWFNPILYFYRRSLRIVHEFQVDNNLIESGIKKSDYLNLMLNTIFYKRSVLALQSNFNAITIKKRINMITKDKSSKMNLLKYLLIFPLIATILFSFAHQENIEQVETSNVSSKKYAFPIDQNIKYRFTSKYGKKIHPFYKKEMFHTGVDLATREGAPIFACSKGEVSKVVSVKTGFGNYIVINQEDGYQSIYAHNKVNLVSLGEKVEAGQKIAEIGQTGVASGPHIHFEIRKNGKNINPETYLKERGFNILPNKN
jgi:murein DD-endopeptidase MepM/ murein hydrolase activator NlpD